MATPTIPSLIDRGDIHKSCKSLETVASILVTYTETLNTLVSINKKLAKALRDTAVIKGTNGIPANALNASACIFEALYEVDTKFVKIADKEVDTLADDIKKWFKKLAKEEKAHDERLASASAKLKQAGQAYEKKSKRKDADLSEEHSRYLAVLNTLGPEMTQDKQNHAIFVTNRHTTLISQVAASISRLAETEWGRACEHVRKFAPFVGGIGECRALCEGGWNGDLPADLPDEGVDTTTSSNDEPTKTKQDIGPDLISGLPSTPTALEPISSDTISSPQNVRSRSNTLQVIDNTPKRDISQSPRQTLLSAPGREDSDDKRPSPELSTLASTVPPDPPTVQRSPSPFDYRAGTITEEPEQSEQLSEQQSTREPSAGSSSKEFNPQSQVSNVPPGALSPFSNRVQKLQPHPSLTTKANIDPIGKPASVSNQSRPLPLPSPKAIRRVDLERMESTDSLTNRVAAMRDRYDSRMTDATSDQTPRDFPRPSQRVSELATRYISPPLEPKSPTSLQTGLAHSDHFPTFQERYSHSGAKFSRTVASKPTPESYRQVLEQNPLAEYEDEVLKYSGVTLQDRDGGYLRRPLGDERFQMPRTESAYYDEMGVRTRDNLIPGTQELRAREALLLEQERRIEVERERLLSMRESVAADANSPYGRRYTESPGPFSSNQVITPEDHPSDCECMRCSQLYVTNASRQGSNQPLPSPLRPGDTGRRLSAGPSPLLGHPGRNIGMSIGNISSPTIAHMNVPPEDPTRGGRRRSFDNTNNRNLQTKVTVNDQISPRDGRHRNTKSQDFFTKMFMH